MISVGFMYSFGQLLGFFLWSSQLRNNLLLTRHVAETHSEGVIPSSFPNKFPLGIKGRFSIFYIGFLGHQDASAEIFFQVESEIQSNTWRVSVRMPRKCFNTWFFFPPTYWRKENTAAIHHVVRFMPSWKIHLLTGSEQRHSGFPPSRNVTWPDKTSTWAVRSQRGNSPDGLDSTGREVPKWQMHCACSTCSLRKGCLHDFGASLRKRCDWSWKQKGKQCWWDEVVHKSVQLPSC